MMEETGMGYELLGETVSQPFTIGPYEVNLDQDALKALQMEWNTCFPTFNEQYETLKPQLEVDYEGNIAFIRGLEPVEV